MSSILLSFLTRPTESDGGGRAEGAGSGESSRPSVLPNPKASDEELRLMSCNLGPGVQDGETLVGDILCDGVWQRVTDRGTGCVKMWRDD